MTFRNSFGENIFNTKYINHTGQTWEGKSRLIVNDVTSLVFKKSEMDELYQYISSFKFMPAGRYIYYAGRLARFYNNCYLLKGEEDTREEWGALCHRSSSCLMTGGGIGTDYSVFRPEGTPLGRTGGFASGPIPLMHTINEIGRNVMQGASRRAAIYASLNWQHGDIDSFLKVKDWANMEVVPGLTYKKAKELDFNAHAPLDMTNISLNYDDSFLEALKKPRTPLTFLQNIRYACMNGEPGFSFNFGEKSKETLRNACTEVSSEDDSDVCNLGSVNMGAIDEIEEFKKVVRLGSKFLVCGSLVADLPYQKVAEIRAKNRRLGLGIMGVHEWLIKRGYSYEMNEELRSWMKVYQEESERGANELCDELGVSRPVAYRAIAPTGTIGILAGTTTGIEPLYAVAYKRRYLKGKKSWSYEYVIDNTAEIMIEQYSVDPSSIETAHSLAKNPEQRIKFQADIQDYVDMCISSTLNLPPWGSEYNNDKTVIQLANTVAKYAHRLRGLTFYPDGARGGQPLTVADYHEARSKRGVVHEDNDSCKGGVCGL